MSQFAPEALDDPRDRLRVVVTGAAGFVGTRLCEALLATPALPVAGAAPRPIGSLVLLDRVAPREHLLGDPRVTAHRGDLLDLVRADALRDGADVVFHLAGAVSAECEADFDLGMHSNLAATMALLEAARALPRPPVFVFSSSLAVHGRPPGRPPHEVITDDTLPTPRTSYGVQKFVLEQLVGDYTRKGFIDGRSVRLMTVVVRPGKPNRAASGFLSGVIREPLAGVRATVPVPPDTEVAIASPARTVEGLLAACRLAREAWGPPLAVQLPGVRTTVAEMVAALGRIAGKEVAALVDWELDPVIAEVVSGWPARFVNQRTEALGLRPDDGIDEIIRAYVEETMPPR